MKGGESMKESTDRGSAALRAAHRAGMPMEDEVTARELAVLQEELMEQDRSWGAIYEAILWAYCTGYQRGAARGKGSAAGQVEDEPGRISFSGGNRKCI